MRPRRSAPTALLLAAVPALLAGPAAGQTADPTWIHLSALPGVVAASVPGDAPRPAALLQLEVSRTLPIGIGVGFGYALGSADRGAAEPAGPWGEAMFAYRFRLRFRGWLAPYAGPVLGAALHDVDAPGAPPDAEGWITRWHFGGRAGLDIPVGGGWPAVRVELAYRHSPSAGGLAGWDLTTATLGLRWSKAMVGARDD